LQLGLRVQSSVDIKRQNLQLDLELVPYVPKGVLDTVLLDILGTFSFRTNPEGHVAWLNQMLSRLSVRCTYIPPTRDAMAKGMRADILFDSNMNRGRQFRIKEFKMAKEVPTFHIDGTTYQVKPYSNESKLEYSTPDWLWLIVFAEILAESRPLHSPTLPHVSDDDQQWYPLEVLCFDHPQALAQPKKHTLLTHAVQEKIRVFLQQINGSMIIEHLRPFFERFGNLDTSDVSCPSSLVVDILTPCRDLFSLAGCWKALETSRFSLIFFSLAPSRCTKRKEKMSFYSPRCRTLRSLTQPTVPTHYFTKFAEASWTVAN
jgi:hypothetical protein